LAGWLTYEDMRRKVHHHEERTLYEPIREIAEANGYHVEREFPLPRKPGQLGAPKQSISFSQMPRLDDSQFSK
jgi:hypothetical protein